MELRTNGAGTARDEWSHGRGQGRVMGGCVSAQANSSAGSCGAAAGTGKRGCTQVVWAGGARQRRMKKGKKLLFA